MINIKLRESNINEHQCGDIILTKSTGISSKGNIVVQSAMTVNKAEYTHALLCLGTGRFVEATIGEKLLSFHYKDEKRTSLDSEKWKVLRYTPFNLCYAEALYKSVSVHLGKDYYLRNKESKTFCSAFIALVYNDLFKDLFKKPHKKLPVNLQNLEKQNDNWEDVTVEYKSDLIGTPFLTDDEIIDTTNFFNYTYFHSADTVSALEIVDDIEKSYFEIGKFLEKRGYDLPELPNGGESDTNTEVENWSITRYKRKKKE